MRDQWIRASAFATVLLLIVPFLFVIGILTPYGAHDSDGKDRIFTLAIANRDISICDKVHLIGLIKPDWRTECYKEFGYSHPNEDICSRLLGNTFFERNILENQVQEFSNLLNFSGCIESQARGGHDARRCLQIDERRFRILCVRSVAIIEKNSIVCSVLPLGEEKEQCLAGVQ